MPRRSSRRLSKDLMEGENKQPAEVEEPEKLAEKKQEEPVASDDHNDGDAKAEDAPPKATDNATENSNETHEEKKDDTGEKRSGDAEKEIEIPPKKAKLEDSNEDGQDGPGEEEEAKTSPPPLVKEKKDAVTEENEEEKTTLTAEA